LPRSPRVEAVARTRGNNTLLKAAIQECSKAVNKHHIVLDRVLLNCYFAEKSNSDSQQRLLS